MINFIVDFLFGALMGALGGFFGIGGGLVVIPIMALLLGLSQTTAQGTALVMMVPNVALALWKYQQKSPICWSLALPLAAMGDRVPRSGVTEPVEGALWAKEDGHRGSWLTLSLRRPNEHQENHDDQAHYRIDRAG